MSHKSSPKEPHPLVKMSESNQSPAAGQSADRLDAYFCIPIDNPRVRSALANAGRQLPPIDPKKYHLTLRYIKSVSAPAAEILANAGQQICQQPRFDLRLGRPGRFDQPPVDWYGVEASPELMKLQADLGSAVVALGHPPADYDYNPHISLGRCRQAGLVLAVAPISWTVEAVEFRRVRSGSLAKPAPIRLALESD